MLGTAKLLRDEHIHPVELREKRHLPGRHDDPRDPRARAGRGPRRVPERDQRREWSGARSSPAAMTDAELRVLDDPAAALGRLLPRGAAGETIVLTGGSSVGRAYEPAASRPTGAPRVWWGDERCVPPDDERSNYALAKRTLLDRLDRPSLPCTGFAASSRRPRRPPNTNASSKGSSSTCCCSGSAPTATSPRSSPAPPSSPSARAWSRAAPRASSPGSIVSR